MLQRPALHDQYSEESVGAALTPSYIFEIVKRRALYFAIPFTIALVFGSFIALAWPAKYLSAGKLLVQAQEIPTDLVRPTVVSLASERIQVIEQRIMTRDNILAIAKKFGLSHTWRGQLSGTQLIDFIKSRIKIMPLALALDGNRKRAIAFTVGFEDEQPITAMRVANEILTMILNEDAQSRSSFAIETAKFLEKNVQRLEGQLSLLDNQITTLRQEGFVPGISHEKQLAALKAELLLKRATYSNAHPDVVALKQRIKSLQKAVSAGHAETKALQDAKAVANTSEPKNAGGLGVDTLETKRKSLRDELNRAQQKLAVARLGEHLEKDQRAERLEIIEQPTLPTKPVSPNRPKLFAFVIAIAFMAGGGLAAAAEMFDQSIHRSADLESIFGSHMVVSIPYISTRQEVRRKKAKFFLIVAILVALVIGALATVIFVLPPPDILFEKLMTILLK